MRTASHGCAGKRLLLLLCILLLPACATSKSGGVNQQTPAGGGSYIACPDSTNTSAAEPEKGPVTLTVTGWTSTPAEDALTQHNLQKFEALHPNIKINWSPIPGDYLTKMRANVASKTVPDVFYLQPAMSSQYISSGKLLNLSPYMARDGVRASDYYDALLKPFVCTGGQVYGLPKDWSSLGVFYNKQMFRAASMPFPAANWTWDNLQNAARRLTRNAGTRDAVYGIVLSADLARWGAFLFAAGGSILNKEGTRATFNNQQGVRALQFYSSFFRQRSGALPTTVGAPWNGDAFGKQRAAMIVEGSWLLPYMASTYPGVQYTIAPLPRTPEGGRANLTFTNAWSAYAGTNHPEAAWELIRYMTGASVQESQLNAGFALPTLRSLADAPYFSTHPDFKVLFEAASYGCADYYGPLDASIRADVSNAIGAVLLAKQEAQAALDDAATKINNELRGE